MKKSFLVSAAIALLAISGMAQAESIYNNIPSTLEHSYVSQPYQAQQTFEFGDRITFGGTGRQLESATFTMVDWAIKGDPGTTGTSTGFNHDFTLNLYQAGTGYSHGALIASVSEKHFVPYRPAVWDKNGFAFNMTFNLSGITVPDSIVYGLAFNTQTYGKNPMGVQGPYNSLNFGLSDAVNGGLTVGTTDLDRVFWGTSNALWYADGGAHGVNTFRMDDGADWAQYVPMANFTATSAVPEPATLLGFGLPMLMVGLGKIRGLRK